MAYPASTKTLAQWVADVDQKASLTLQLAQQQSSLSSAGNLDMDQVRRFYDWLVSANVFFTQAAAVSGIASYLTAQKQGQSADPVADFQAMQAQVQNTISWLQTNVPGGTFGGTTYKLGVLFPADFVTPSSPLKFTAAQTSTYRTALSALIATIS